MKSKHQEKACIHELHDCYTYRYCAMECQHCQSQEADTWTRELRLLMANFAMYIDNDTGEENDRHEAEILKFETFIARLLSQTEQAVYDRVEKEVIGEDEEVYKLKVDSTNRKSKEAFSRRINEGLGRNLLRIEQRKRLAELRK